jgi:twitching motility protein PilT
MDVNDILIFSAKMGASDIHLTVNCPPAFRINGSLFHPGMPDWKVELEIGEEYHNPLTSADTKFLAGQIMNESQKLKYSETGECDFAYTLTGYGRFRVNAYRQKGHCALAVRRLSNVIPALDSLGLPPVVSSLAKKPRGLVLVTGPTGSGKSTTLAAMIDLINRESRKHIITLEDPVEYIHQHKNSVINQREIGCDTASFASALRAAMREDPDVILVGEMRDTETIAIAVTAAETGHLVLGTVHTASASQTIDRIIDVFPPHQQQQIRVQLSNTLQGVVAQQLIPRADCAGRVLAVEVMVVTPAIKNMIRENKTYQIISQIQTGGKYGMQTMDMVLRQLITKGLISREQAVACAEDPECFLL